MTNIIKRYYYVFFFLCITLIYCFGFPCHMSASRKLADPVLRIGNAKLSGRIENFTLLPKESSVYVDAIVYSPITGQHEYRTVLEQDQTFHLNIPLDCTTAIGSLRISSDTEYYGFFIVGLSQKEKLNLDIKFNKNENSMIITESKGGLGLTSNETVSFGGAIMAFEEFHSPDKYYRMTPEEFVNQELNFNLKERMKAAFNVYNQSERINNYLRNSLELLFFNGKLFQYKEEAERSYRNTTDKVESNYVASEPDASYYSFLNQYELTPQHLYCFSYSGFIKAFLSIKAFDIPTVGNTSIKVWIDEVKGRIKKVLKIDSELFYDLLAANSFDLQLSYENKPLTKTQIANITNYYSTQNSAIATVLLNQNSQLIEKLKSSQDLKVKNTPNVAKEKLMDTLIAGYKGKVVLVDFWATWCTPCADAIKKIRGLKEALKEKDVVFVYIANPSSPKKVWKNQIKIIGGEHYYLTADEWSFITEQFEFNTIPTYLIYNSKGSLKDKSIGFPGIKKMQALLENALEE